MAALEDYAWDTFKGDLWDIMQPFYLEVFGMAYEDAVRDFGFGGIAWNQSNPLVKKALKARENLIKGVADTVFEHVKLLTEKQNEEGFTAQELAKRIRELGLTDSKSRSLMIARTESAVGANVGATMAYRDAGIEKVKVLDGDEDAECASADGAIWTIDEAEANPIAHPNCVRAFAPYVD
jgi:hypothetical protein